jgi:hypothetical protein
MQWPFSSGYAGPTAGMRLFGRQNVLKFNQILALHDIFN